MYSKTEMFNEIMFFAEIIFLCITIQRLNTFFGQFYTQKNAYPESECSETLTGSISTR